MFDKDLFDRSPFDRQHFLENQLASSVIGGVTISGRVSGRAAVDTAINGSWTISGILCLRIPLHADVMFSGDVEADRLFVRARLFPDELGILSAFHGEIGASASLVAEAITGVDMESSFLKTRVMLPESSIPVAGELAASLGLRYPIPAMEIPFDAAITGSANIRAAVLSSGIEIGGSILSAPITEPGTARLELQNINVPPGGEIVIDTDILEVLINGVINVDAVTGDSEFFQLYPGNNRITIMASESGRVLGVNLVWSNRWL